uniref:Potassium channel regulatory factor, putative n=1 Tax=Arundo donax TaxID=35708 RepID=A0A0A9GPC7_ARUDO
MSRRKSLVCPSPISAASTSASAAGSSRTS